MGILPGIMKKPFWILEAFHIRHYGLDPGTSAGHAPEIRISAWIPAFVGMTP
jgi:hypothetical protein